MGKKNVVYTCSSLYAIDPAFLRSLGVRALVADLDNTLDTYQTQIPSPKAVRLREELRSYGIRLLILSNNWKSRVRPYAKALQVPYLPFSLKLFTPRIRRFLRKNGLAVKDCAFVGDQLVSDGVYARKLHGLFILTEPLSPEDNLPTRLLRGYDRHRRRSLAKKGRLGNPCPTRPERGEETCSSRKQKPAV
jgi:HAD superfamily phosphatase (TIGR01668 family)